MVLPEGQVFDHSVLAVTKPALHPAMGAACATACGVRCGAIVALRACSTLRWTIQATRFVRTAGGAHENEGQGKGCEEVVHDEAI